MCRATPDPGQQQRDSWLVRPPTSNCSLGLAQWARSGGHGRALRRHGCALRAGGVAHPLRLMSIAP